jgi:4-amino-4-deoxy-L-arabinose transferase-like glycosyltransferase
MLCLPSVGSKQESLSSDVLLELSLLTLVVLITAIPFIKQPFHMDDNFYMDMARNVLHNPRYPYQTSYIFEGKLLADMASHSHPPFQAYFLAGILYLFGEGPGKEWIYHACGLVFPLLAVVAFYFLASRFLSKPLWPALLLSCSPLFVVMQHNLMTDVPNLAFWLAATVTFVRATEKKSNAAYIASAIFQSAAIFTSYQSLALTLLLGFYHVRKRNDSAGWLALSAPIALMGVWLAANCVHYNRFLLEETARYVQSRNGWNPSKLAIKLAAIIQYQGWLIVFPLVLLYMFAHGLAGRCLAVGSLIIAHAAWFMAPQYNLPNKIVLLIGAIAGLAVVLEMSREVFAVNTEWGKTDRQFLLLWYFGVFAYCLVLFPNGSARYVLPMIPPVLILFCRQSEIWSRKKLTALNSGAVLGLVAVLSGTSALALSHADLEFASIYPKAARDFTLIAGHQDSYFGGEWGFRYYLGQAGVRQLPPSKLPASGLLVRPMLALPYGLDKNSLDMTASVREIAYHVTTPLRVLDRYSPAGFYSTHWGILPFSLSWDNLEIIEVRQIQSLARPVTR